FDAAGFPPILGGGSAADRLEPVPSLLPLESAPLNRREDRRSRAARAPLKVARATSCSLHLVGDVHPRNDDLDRGHARGRRSPRRRFRSLSRGRAVCPDGIPSFSMTQAPSEGATLPRSFFPVRCFTANISCSRVPPLKTRRKPPMAGAAPPPFLPASNH